MERTSAAIQALRTFSKLYPGHRKQDLEHCIEKASSFIQEIQRSDGSWFASLVQDVTFFIEKIMN